MPPKANGTARWIGVIFTIVTAVIILAAWGGGIEARLTNAEATSIRIEANSIRIEAKLDRLIEFLMESPDG